MSVETLFGLVPALRRGTMDRAAGWIEWRNHDFGGVHSFVAFAGYPRSAHSLLGSLVTAHPDAVVSHELDALRYVRCHIDRPSLFGLVVRRDRQFAMDGSRWSGYDYSVDGQWQGRYRHLRVLGDKKGGSTSLQLHRHPDLLERLRVTVRVPVRFVIVTRHPLDNIARMSLRSQSSLGHAAEVFFRMSAAIEWLTGQADCLVVRHEDFVADIRTELRRLTDWLALEADDGWAQSCAAIVNPSPRLARTEVEWPQPLLEHVQARSGEHPLLAGYAF